MLPDDSLLKSTRKIGAFTVGQIVGFIWKAMWTVITPVTLIGILIWSFIDFAPVKYGDTDLPGWAHLIGWSLLIGALLLIPFAASRTVFKNFKESGNCGDGFTRSKEPNDQWKPKDPKNRTGPRYGKNRARDEDHEMLSNTEVLATGTNRIISARSSQSYATGQLR